MSNFILTGLFTEGNTDLRFLSSVVERTLLEVAYDCTGDIETKLEIIPIKKTKLDFIQQVNLASKVGHESLGITILFVHVDSDSFDDSEVFTSKINPAIENLEKLNKNEFCQNLVAIVPIQMTESWMIADRELLKSEIGIYKSDSELGINVNPETISNPKALINEIIKISKEEMTMRKRKRGLDISELYQIIGQKIQLSELEKLSSYIKFKESLIQKLRYLNFYHKP
ncbi:MAG: hypothetical protein ACK4RM_09810 [Flavobacterium sp.]